MRSLVTGWLWLILGLVVANRAGTYATAMAGPPVGDLMLDHIPTLDLTTLHVSVAIGYWLCVVAWILAHPQAHAFTTRAFTVLLVVRSFFISITHLGPPPNLLKVEGPFAELILFTAKCARLNAPPPRRFNFRFVARGRFAARCSFGKLA